MSKEKEEVLKNPGLQLAIIQYCYPQAIPGEKFKIRNEKTPSASLKLFADRWLLNDFGDTDKAKDCFTVLMEHKNIDFAEALIFIKEQFLGKDFRYNDLYSRRHKTTNRSNLKHIKESINTLKGNSKTQATEYLLKRGIDTSKLPEDAYFYDDRLDAVAFVDSAQSVINRRMINPKEKSGKARMSSYANKDPIYDVMFNSSDENVFITEGPIDALSLQGYSSISIFTTSNRIKNPDKLIQYLTNKNVIVAFDNDNAGNNASDLLIKTILRSNLRVKGIQRLILPKESDLNDLLVEGKLHAYLKDRTNYFIYEMHEFNEDDNQSDSDNGKKESKNKIIERLLKKNYEFRYDIIKQRTEFKELNTNNSFKPIDDYFVNTLRRELYLDSLNTSSDNIKKILESDYVRKINPIQDYLKNLSPWDKETDYIAQVCSTVKTIESDNFNSYFKKWLVAVVANAMNDEGCQNHTCLVLSGEQGLFKTTWLDHLCPHALKKYLYTGKIDPSNKDSYTLIAEFFLINIDDQLRQLNKKDENEIKNLITTPSVKYRRPYGSYVHEYPHTASFMASVNGIDFLTDPTGSRRFLPFEVVGTDLEAMKKINMDYVYAQAYYLYQSGFQYWFSFEEITHLYQHNAKFNVSTQEEQYMLDYFEKPEKRNLASNYWQSAKIQSYIEQQTKSRLSSKKIGESLRKLGYEKWQRTINGKTKWVWSIIVKDIISVDKEDENKSEHN